MPTQGQQNRCHSDNAGRPGWTRRKKLMSLTEDIEDFALDLGYSRLGITTADSFPTYIAELESRRHMYDWYITGGYQPISATDPGSIMPSAKSEESSYA